MGSQTALIKPFCIGYHELEAPRSSWPTISVNYSVELELVWTTWHPLTQEEDKKPDGRRKID